jgi:hypothetical protein
MTLKHTNRLLQSVQFESCTAFRQLLTLNSSVSVYQRVLTDSLCRQDSLADLRCEDLPVLMFVFRVRHRLSTCSGRYFVPSRLVDLSAI